MLTARSAVPLRSRRVVVVGSGGFIGGEIARTLEGTGHTVAPVSRREVDLLTDGAADRLESILQPGDSVVITAAVAPVKDNAMLEANIRMGSAICQALARANPAQVVYVSSDAVYRDSDRPLAEGSCAEPGSLHGAMHVTREVMLRAACPESLCIVRPTLVYGVGDPHNGYGPNRFMRSALTEGVIAVFGHGEERRDHVHVSDVAGLVGAIVESDSVGILNAATGQGHTFLSVAERIMQLVDRPVELRNLPRSGPMPHGGYRVFDASQTTAAFPEFAYTPLEQGLAECLSQMAEGDRG